MEAATIRGQHMGQRDATWNGGTRTLDERGPGILKFKNRRFAAIIVQVQIRALLRSESPHIPYFNLACNQVRV